jgi:hypothetical protein
LDDGCGNADRAFVARTLHGGFDSAALRQVAAVKCFQAFKRHEVRACDGGAGVSAQADGIGVAILHDALLCRAEKFGERVLDGQRRGLLEKFGKVFLSHTVSFCFKEVV